MALPILDLSGSPREVGRAHGEAGRERIGYNVELYFHRFEVEAGVPRSEALDRAAQYLGVIQRREPDYAALVQGIAEASGCELLEIAALNARYEILYSEFARAVMDEATKGGAAAPEDLLGEPDGCSAFGVEPAASPDGHLRLGQNWDWIPGVQGLLLRIERPDGLRVLCFTEAGIAGGKIGLNSAGLGLVINGLVSNRDSWARLQTPFHVRTWRALNSRTLGEATDAILGEARSCSANFLLAQAAGAGEGRVIDIEAAPDTNRTLPPQRGLLAHTNHFLDADRLDIWQPLDARSSTFRRCSRLQDLLDGSSGRLDAKALTAILRDHEGYPQSICTHPSPLWPEEERYQTVFSVVMDLHAGEMLACPGNPCTYAYQQVSLT